MEAVESVEDINREQEEAAEHEFTELEQNIDEKEDIEFEVMILKIIS